VKRPSKLPPILIAAHEHGRLRLTAQPLADRGSPTAKFLLSELDRAIVCRPDEIPDDTVTMNCRTTYRIGDSNEPETRFLVYPEDYALHVGQISILSAVGAALIGLRVGDRMPYRTPDGAEHEVVVERIDYRPQAKVLPFRMPHRPPMMRSGDPGPDGAA